MTTSIITISMQDIMLKQGIMRLNTQGSVGAGKTTLNEALTHINTLKYEKERVQGTTINLGYADLCIYKNVKTNEFILNPKDKDITDDCILITHLSIGDNPGHKQYTSVLISSSSMVDIVLFAVSAVNGIEEQTLQHLRCFKLTHCKNICFCITKTDLISTKEKMNEIKDKIYDMLNDEEIDESIDPPIIPISTIGDKLNIDKIVKYLASIKPDIKTIELNANKSFKFPIIRSFDINNLKNTSIDNFKGGVIGGVIHTGHICVNDLIVIFPGRIFNNNNVNYYMPYVSKVININTGKSLDVAIPGGFIGIETTLDPKLTKSNAMVGQIALRMSSNDIEQTLKEVGGVITKTFIISDVDMLMNVGMQINNIYILMINGLEYRTKLLNITNKIYIFESFTPTFLIHGDKIAIISNEKNNELDLIAYGYIDNTNNTTNNYTIHKQIDFDDYIKTINIINDRKIQIIDDLHNIHNEIDQDDFLNTQSMIDNLKFNKIKYDIDVPNPTIEKTTTSVSITNPDIIFSLFTDDQIKLNTIIKDFATYIVSKFVLLQDHKVSINVEEKRITYHNVKKTTRQFHEPEFRRILYDYIISKFTCITCKTIGSVFHTKQETLCKACKAKLSSK